MTWVSKRGKWDWKGFLTEEEARIIDDIESQIAVAKHRLEELSAVRGPIQNRATQRAKYASRHPDILAEIDRLSATHPSDGYSQGGRR